jgi:hypothetical protein
MYILRSAEIDAKVKNQKLSMLEKQGMESYLAKSNRKNEEQLEHRIANTDYRC